MLARPSSVGGGPHIPCSRSAGGKGDGEKREGGKGWGVWFTKHVHTHTSNNPPRILSEASCSPVRSYNTPHCESVRIPTRQTFPKDPSVKKKKKISSSSTLKHLYYPIRLMMGFTKFKSLCPLRNQPVSMGIGTVTGPFFKKYTSFIVWRLIGIRSREAHPCHCFYTPGLMRVRWAGEWQRQRGRRSGGRESKSLAAELSSRLSLVIYVVLAVCLRVFIARPYTYLCVHVVKSVCLGKACETE